MERNQNNFQNQFQSQNQFKEYEIPIGNSYKLDTRRKLGKGQFYEVYYGLDKKNNEEVAIKLEPISSRYNQLLYESKVYQILDGVTGIPKFIWYGKQENYNILIIELLGRSLEDIFNYCKRNFSLLTTLMVVEQMISRIEYIHNKNFIHRNLSPENFLIGRKNKKNIIYLIDFLFAKRYNNPKKNNEHIPFRDGKAQIGNSRYSSINSQLGLEQSRRDDVESLGYILVYFMKGKLPWQGIKATTSKEKFERIKDRKIMTTVDSLCEGLPNEVKIFIEYTKNLKFEENPHYLFLKNILREIAIKNSINFNYSKFDWIIKKEKKNNKDNNEKDNENEEKNEEE